MSAQESLFTLPLHTSCQWSELHQCTTCEPIIVSKLGALPGLIPSPIIRQPKDMKPYKRANDIIYWLSNIELGAKKSKKEQVETVENFYRDIGFPVVEGLVESISFVPMAATRYAIRFSVSATAVPRMTNSRLYSALFDFNQKKFSGQQDPYEFYVSLSEGSAEMPTLHALHRLLPYFARNHKESSWMVFNGEMAAMKGITISSFSLAELREKFPDLVRKAYNKSNKRQQANLATR